MARAKLIPVDPGELGFGFNPAESGHHFVLILPGEGEDGPAVLEERFGYGETADVQRAEPRARVDAYTWGRLVEGVQAHFNRRLSDARRRAGVFQHGENFFAPHLGKELALLFWASDGLDPTDLPNALANWQGFAPEERWWLYTTVKASGAGPDEGRDRGWRKAIRIAFAESPAPPRSDGARGFLRNDSSAESQPQAILYHSVALPEDLREETEGEEPEPVHTPRARARRSRVEAPSLFD